MIVITGISLCLQKSIMRRRNDGPAGKLGFCCVTGSLLAVGIWLKGKRASKYGLGVTG